MRKIIYLFIATSLLFISCDKEEDNNPTTEIPEGEGNVELQSEVNEFIWQGLNYWYFWQGDQTYLIN
jgi:hypothetical protein